FVQLYSANFTNVGKWPHFEIQILRYSTLPHNATSVLQREFRVKPFDLIHPKENDDLLGTKVWRDAVGEPEESTGLTQLKDKIIEQDLGFEEFKSNSIYPQACRIKRLGEFGHL